jgi:hypothetical protein
LQFWFVGDGPARESIYSRLRSDGLRQSVAMPGSFGQMMDVFVAADLMVHVGDEGYAAHVPAAVSAAIPLVVANTTVAREFFSITARRAEQQIEATRRGVVPGPDEVQACDQAGELVWWFDPGKPSTLRKAISAVVENLEAARRRARRARQLLQQARPRGAEIDAYGQLFRRLIRQHRQARVGSGRGEER